ncbi:MAG TPA: FeoB-associated Cys-rich membrane protein [Firmicutes bacterium]|nr:FeoB-associated Cys-rich membrane protein [Bacillota bacterium]
MNLADFFLLILLLSAVAAVLFFQRKGRHSSGCTGCSGCSGCSAKHGIHCKKVPSPQKTGKPFQNASRQ